MVDRGARDAARARAAADRQQAARRARRRRTLIVASVVVAVLAGAGVVTAAVLDGSSAPAAVAATGRTGAPPWPAPTDVRARVAAAGLPMLTAEGEALHIHEHLTVTVDGTAVIVPADLGIDQAARQLSAIHTHDDSGIVHVESPVVKTFTLGQVFTEWGVHLAAGQVGGYRDGRDGVRVALYVDRAPYTGDPTRLALASKQDLDFVVTTDGSAPKPPATAFTFPAGY